MRRVNQGVDTALSTICEAISIYQDRIDELTAVP
jgi:hypothetical protein